MHKYLCQLLTIAIFFFTYAPGNAADNVPAIWFAQPAVEIGSHASVSALAVTTEAAESEISYTWSLISGPATVNFTPNGTNSAKKPLVHYQQSGSYRFRCVASHQSLSAMSDVNIVVDVVGLAINKGTARLNEMGTMDGPFAKYYPGAQAGLMGLSLLYYDRNLTTNPYKLKLAQLTNDCLVNISNLDFPFQLAFLANIQDVAPRRNIRSALGSWQRNIPEEYPELATYGALALSLACLKNRGYQNGQNGFAQVSNFVTSLLHQGRYCYGWSTYDINAEDFKWEHTGNLFYPESEYWGTGEYVRLQSNYTNYPNVGSFANGGVRGLELYGMYNYFFMALACRHSANKSDWTLAKNQLYPKLSNWILTNDANVKDPWSLAMALLVLHLDDAGVPPPDEPCFCPSRSSKGNSRIDNVRQAHIHDAIDWAMGSAASNCAPCALGSSGGDGSSPPHLAVKRWHRYRDQAWRGSFGPGVFSNLDQQLRLYGNGATTDGHIEWFAPDGDAPVWLKGAGQATGEFTDSAFKQVKRFVLTDTANQPVATMTAARKATLTRWDGSILKFDVIPPVTGMASSDGFARLVSESDSTGRVIMQVSYQNVIPAPQAGVDLGDANGSALWKIASITDAYGVSASFTYGESDNQYVVTSISLPGGKIITYQYGLNDLVGLNGITYPDGSMSSFNTRFDDAAQLQVIDMQDAGATGIHRGKSVFVTPTLLKIDADTSQNLPSNRVRKIVNSANEVSWEGWSQRSGSTERFYANEGGTLKRYSTIGGLPSAEQKALSWSHATDESTWTWQNVYAYEVDTQGRITGRTDALNRVQGFTRDPVSGRVAGNSISGPEGSLAATSKTYDPVTNLLMSEVDRTGIITNYEYDGARRMTKETQTKGTSSVFQQWFYDAAGNLSYTIDRTGNRTDYSYDAFNRLVDVQQPPDKIGVPRALTHRTYDAVGRLDTVTDPLLHVTTFHYDTRSRLDKMTYDDGSFESMTYGISGNGTNMLVEKRDRNGNKTVISYDAAGRKVSEELFPPVGTVAAASNTWSYLPGTTMVLSQTVDGETTNYGYDALHRVISTTRNTAGTATITTTTDYDAVGRVWRTTDDQGRRTWTVYDVDDRVIRTVNETIPLGAAIAADPVVARDELLALIRPAATTTNSATTITDISYDDEGRVLSQRDPLDIKSSTVYDDLGRVAARIAADRIASTINLKAERAEMSYDGEGRQTQVVHPRSFTRAADGTFSLITGTPYVSSYSYTRRGLLASMSVAVGSPDAATVNYTYTLNGKKATESDPRNATWLTLFRYNGCCGDAGDRLYQIEDPSGYITQLEYDLNGNQTAIIDANNNRAETTYDARNRVVSRKNALLKTTTMTYDENLTDGVGIEAVNSSLVTGLGFGAGANGSATMVTDATGVRTYEVRDGLGRVVRQASSVGQTTITYVTAATANGLRETLVTDPVGNVTRSRADGAGRVREQIDAENRQTTMSYDAVGRLLVLRDANGVGYDATYDPMGRPLTQRSTHGEQTSTTYDLHGNVLTATDALLNVTTCTYDYRDRKSTCTDRIGGLTQYFYDLANHLTTIKDADSAVNGVTTYLYNNLGLLTEETFPAGKDGKKTVRTYTYDAGRRLWTRTLTTTPAATPALNEKTTYGYDVANRLTSRTYTDGKGNDSFVYDDAGRVTKAASGRYGSTVDRAYSGGTPAETAGRLRTEKLTLTGSNAGNWTVTYGYDAANRVTDLTYPTSDKVTRTYTPRHQLDTVKIGASTVATRLYDFSGRLITTTLGNNQVENRTYRSDANGADNQLATQSISGATNFAYTYDANGRITEEKNITLPALTQNFLGYDNENRLTNWKRGSDTQSWTLSKVGDWTSTTINGTAQIRTHSAVHEVTALGVTPINYDLKGNLTLNQDGSAYNWDSENRLTSATVSDANYGTSDTATYRYDALGRRVQKTVYGMVTTFIHAGAQVVHEFDAKIQLPSASATDDGNGTGAPPGGGILQGAGVTRFNYQPSLSPIPSGFFADKGSVFGVRSNGKSYGWLTAARTDTVIRNQHPLPQFDTFNQAWLNNVGSAGTWEITVANGTYAVIVVMGDAASANQTNNLTIEGQAQTDPDPAVVTPPGYRRGDFDGYAVTANVTDGKLTLAIPATALNPKLCFIEIGPQGSSITQADRDRLASAITDAVSDTGLPPFPKVQPSPRLYVYGSYVDEPLMMKAGGQNYYYATNRLYSVAAISDQTGAVVERYKYDAYGKQGILAPNGVVAYKPSDYGQFHGFTGRYHDWETGLAYFRARYFDHSLGRFIGRDPWQIAESEPSALDGYQDGYSLYQAYYVPNGLDPTGMDYLACLANCISQNDPMNVIIDSAIAKIAVGGAGIPKSLILWVAELKGDADLIRQIKFSITNGFPIALKPMKVVAQWLGANRAKAAAAGRSHAYLAAVYGGVLFAVEINCAYHCICRDSYTGDNTLNIRAAIDQYMSLFSGM